MIARQIFPIEIDIDHPRWKPLLRKMADAFGDMEAAHKQGGIGGKLKGWAASTRAAFAFAGCT